MSSYIDHRACQVLRKGQWVYGEAHSWVDFTWSRLAEQYGADQARRIVAGRDPATQADVDAWNKLGTRRAA